MRFHATRSVPFAICIAGLLSAASSQAATADYCPQFYKLRVTPRLVPGTPSNSRHYEWVVPTDQAYARHRSLLIKAGFAVRLWEDGRWQMVGRVGNRIRHREMDARFSIKAVYATGHAPVRDWPDVTTGLTWFLGEGRRNRPDVKFKDYKGQDHSMTAARFAMIGDPQFEIGPYLFCSAT